MKALYTSDLSACNESSSQIIKNENKTKRKITLKLKNADYNLWSPASCDDGVAEAVHHNGISKCYYCLNWMVLNT